MRLYPIIYALFLTGCVDTETVALRTSVPADLLEPVKVRCPKGATEAHVARCLVLLRAGVDQGNAKLAAISEIVGPR